MSTTRLTDDEVRDAYGAIRLCHPKILRVHADHLHAREDVKRLAERLRSRIRRCCPEYLRAVTPASCCGHCAQDEAMLDEVEPVRQ